VWPQAPLTPPDLSASAQGGAVTLRWGAAPNEEDRPALAYRLYRHAPGAAWMELATTSADARQYEDRPPAGRYQYALAALNVAGESEWVRTGELVVQ
jgi:hypothetical protein